MHTVQSIQTANIHYETGDRPILVLCSDMQDYVVKHGLNGNATNLVCEYIAASFLKLWNLPVPEFSFVRVNYDHVKHYAMPKRDVELTCFGSRFDKLFVEISQFNDKADLKRNNISEEQKLNLLKISLFDIWLANEDRNQNNLNLLYDVRNACNIIPIDHGAILNSRSLSSKLELLTESESLVSTDLYRHMFKNHYSTKADISNLKDYFYLCANKCTQNFDEILNNTPADWHSAVDAIKIKFQNEVFSHNWKSTVLHTFLEYINSPFR